MSGEDYVFRLEAGGQELQIRADMVALYTFAGEGALYDHVYIELPGDEGCAYIFKTDPEAGDGYENLRQYIADHRLPMMLNLRTVSDDDKAAYNDNVTQYADEFPDYFE